MNVRSTRVVFRVLGRAPVYSATVVATLAMGIASTAAIFSVVRGVIFRPLPYSDAARLVSVQEYQPLQRRDQTTVASANLERLAQAHSFAVVSAFSYSEYVVSDERTAERVVGARVDGKLLDALGVAPGLGRGITGAEAGADPARVAVISNSIWRRRFASDPNAVGRSMILDGDAFTIVGVMPGAFEFPRSPSMTRDVDVWVPRRPASPMMLRRGARDLTVVARLNRDITIDAAREEMRTIAARARADNGALDDGWSLRILPLRDVMVGRVRPALTMLAACVGALLLIAVVNASAASFARVATRRQSFGVRIALGATPRRILELMVAETVVLSAIGLVIALPLSGVLRRTLTSVAPASIPRQSGIAFDGWTLAASGITAVFMAIATVAGPAAWMRTIDITTCLTDSSRTAGDSRSRKRALAAFVVTQLALGTVLLSATARLYTTFAQLNRVDPGFVVDGVTTATLALGSPRYASPAARASLDDALLDRVRAIPGVERAAVVSLLPMSGGLMSSSYAIPGLLNDSTHTAALRSASNDLFATLGIPIHQGRPITRADDAGSAPAVVVNEAFVREAFGVRPALGQSIAVAPPGVESSRLFRIVGIAGDAKERDLLSPSTPIIYFSDHQASFPHAVLVVRSHGAFPGVAIRAAVRDIDPGLALDDVGTLSAKVRASYALQFFLLAILSAFAISASAMIGVGVYGSVSSVVAAESRAISVRMALGASPRRILLSTLARSGAFALGGAVVGIGIAAALSRISGLETVLGTALDWRGASLGAGAVVLLAFVSTLVPAVRASVVDPARVLSGGS